jgi:hypothetical protein
MRLTLISLLFVLTGCIEYPDVSIVSTSTYVNEVTTVNNVTYVEQVTSTVQAITETTEPEPVRYPVIMY